MGASEGYAGCVRRNERCQTAGPSGLQELSALAEGYRRRTCWNTAAREAELLFRRIGITFAVYGEAEAAGAADPLRHHPAHPLGAANGRTLARGLEQRVKALNALPQATSTATREILRAGIVPEDLVFQQPGLPARDERPEGAARHLRPHRRHRHRAGRRRHFYVLEDNARTPSGVSYMLENREIMMRLFPDLFSPPPRRAGRELSGRTAGDAAIGRARVAAGRADRRAADARASSTRAYYEHSFLADKLGIELVEGRDLFVKDDDRLSCARPRGRSAST